MTDWYILLAPMVLLAVLSLLRFVGCTFSPQADAYGVTVSHDHPVAFFRFQETSGDTAHNSAGSPDGTIGTTTLPLDAGDPNWHSTGVASPGFDLGITDPRLEQTEDTNYSAIRFRGGFVSVPADVSPLNNLTDFTVEVLLHPEWDVEFARGKYYCVLENADVVQISGLPPQLQKNAGFGIYAGPDDPTDPVSPYIWQVWMGVGLDGFERLFPVLPYPVVANNPVPNPGPIVTAEPTYLAFTFSQSQNQVFLYVYTPNRDIDYTTYPMNPINYVPASNEMFVGITPQGPLFFPFLGPTLLYPFQGLIADVAIYDRILDEGTLRNHVMNAFFNI